MKQTGIVRKIDDLGRLVIPKEIRKTFRIHEGDSFEIIADSEGLIMLRKYEPMEKLLNSASLSIEIFKDLTDASICITDNEKIVAASGNIRKTYVGREITDKVKEMLVDRISWNTGTELPIKLYDGDNIKNYKSQCIIPIISNTDVLGSIILFTTISGRTLSDVDLKIAKAISKILVNEYE